MIGQCGPAASAAEARGGADVFGYVTINQPEIKFKDYDMYRSFYCGLCAKLKEDYGAAGQMTLTYDLTFLALLLTALYEPETVSGQTRCRTHPWKMMPARTNRYTEYAADMEVVLAYYKCLDDVKDDGSRKKALAAKVLRSRAERAESRHPAKARVIREKLQAISEREEAGETGIEICAGLFGDLLAEIFDAEGDHWSQTLRLMGFYLGKFIYLMDAYEDLEKDRASGSYNPLKSFDGDVEELLTLMMADCCRAFERLPIIEYTDILRNILYSGVWLRYELKNGRRESAGSAPEER